MQFSSSNVKTLYGAVANNTVFKPEKWGFTHEEAMQVCKHVHESHAIKKPFVGKNLELMGINKSGCTFFKNGGKTRRPVQKAEVVEEVLPSGDVKLATKSAKVQRSRHVTRKIADVQHDINETKTQIKEMGQGPGVMQLRSRLRILKTELKEAEEANEKSEERAKNAEIAKTKAREEAEKKAIQDQKEQVEWFMAEEKSKLLAKTKLAEEAFQAERQREAEAQAKAQEDAESRAKKAEEAFQAERWEEAKAQAKAKEAKAREDADSRAKNAEIAKTKLEAAIKAAEELDKAKKEADAKEWASAEKLAQEKSLF